MNLLIPILAYITPSIGALLSLLLWVAIAAVIVWAVVALVAWAGIPIPPPVRIVFIALVCIFLVVLLFRLFGLAV